MGKFRLWISPGYEERFINKQAQLGKKLVQISPFALFVPLDIRYYKFEKTKNTYLFRSDMRSFESLEEAKEYVQLMKDDGWEYFKGNYHPGFWGIQSYYFFRINDKEADEIYSDQTTKLINTYDIASSFFMISLIALMLCFVFPYYQNRPFPDDLASGILSFIWPIVAVVMLVASAITRFIVQRKLKRLALTEGEI